MKVYFRILSLISVVLLAVGCTAQLSFDELTKDVPKKLNTRVHSSVKMSYSISIPKRFELIDKNYSDTMKVEMFVDTTLQFENQLNWLTIIKFNSTETTIDGAWKKFISNRQLIEDFRKYSEGSTDYLSVPSHYEHSACTISKKNVETINFLFRGDSSSFYFVSLQVNTEEGYPDNMKELLYCTKSMKILP